MKNYNSLYKSSITTPRQFWAEAAQDIDWINPWDSVLDDRDQPFNYWFKGATLNTCYNAVDRHVLNGLGDQTALIYDSPVTDTKASYSYQELQNKVSRIAGILTSQGVKKGDRVIIYMPMIAESVMSMLACARIGAVHSVVFGGFAANELATRIEDAQPSMIISASCGIETSKVIEYKPLLDQAIEISSHKPDSCLILQRPQAKADMNSSRDIDWDEALNIAKPTVCVEVKATDPLYILYTSGTTGKPKGVVRDNGGHAVALMWSMKNIYDINPGEVFWAASDVGWVVGHSYICYAPLFNGSTTLVYEGKPIGTPDAGAFWRVIADHKVKSMFTAPTAFRAIRKQDQDGEFIDQYDLSHFQSLFLAGERCDPDTLKWAQEKLNVPVIDHWWQTETGWAIAANCLGIQELPVKPGSPTVAVPGYDVQFLDRDGNKVEAGKMGNIVIKLPLPPGTLQTLWNDDDRLVKSYFSTFDGYYLTGDAGYQDKDGYIYVMGRTDDVINVAGHRLSTGGMEEVLASHQSVAECAVIGVNCGYKGQSPIGFIVTKDQCNVSNEQLIKELIGLVREIIGPVASFKTACVVKRLPKTRSGKILRGTMRSIADGEDYKMPATIDDPVILEEITEDLKGLGYPITG